MINFIGLIGAILFAVSAIPFAVSTYKSGETNSPLSGILLILLGSISMFLYEFETSAKLYSLLDFAVCVVCWGIVLRYKLFPRVNSTNFKGEF